MLTIIDAGRAVDVDARVEGERVLLSERALRDALGWELHEGTLCNDTMCVPLPALFAAEGAAFLGAGAGERADALASLIAPDFTLPDLAGRSHTLSEHRGEKVLLVVWASW